MTLTLTPPAWKIVADYLRDHDDVPTERVVSKTPKDTDEGWVRYTQIAKPDRAAPTDYFVEAYLQFDCYAGKDGGLPEADRLSRAVRAAIVDMDQADIDGAVVTGTEIRGDSYQPDLALDSRERFIISAVVWMHR